MSPKNNWDTEYTAILFLERALAGHTKVQSFVREMDIKFKIERTIGLCPVTAVLVGRYTIGLADVIKAKCEFSDMDCIVAPGNWCGYTREAKEHGLRNGIGVFQMNEFLGALSRSDVIHYVQKDANGKPVHHYRHT